MTELTATEFELLHARACLINDITDLTTKLLEETDPFVSFVFDDSPVDLMGYGIFLDEQQYKTLPIIHGFKNGESLAFAVYNGNLYEVPYFNVGVGIFIEYYLDDPIFLPAIEFVTDKNTENPINMFLNLGYIPPNRNASPNLRLPKQNKTSVKFASNLAIGIDDLTPLASNTILEQIKKGLITDNKVI